MNTGNILTQNQSKPQSSSNASLLMPEVLNKTKYRHVDFTLVPMVAIKAFDVIWQEFILKIVFLEYVDGIIWLTFTRTCMPRQPHWLNAASMYKLPTMSDKV